jgi:hypothetical protein
MDEQMEFACGFLRNFVPFMLRLWKEYNPIDRANLFLL